VKNNLQLEKSSKSLREELLLHAENVPRSKDDSVNGATDSAIANINGKISITVQRDKAPDRKVDDDKATKDKTSGDKAKKKRLLDIAENHPLVDGSSTTVAKDKPDPTDAEAAENKSVENETLNNADVDNESIASEDDSDSSDGSSVPDGDKKAKNEKASKRGKQKGKGKGKGKKDREKKKERKQRREDKKKDKGTDDQKESATSLSSKENARREEKREIRTRSSSKVEAGNVALKSSAAIKSQDEKSKETPTQDSQRNFDRINVKKQSSTLTCSTGDADELQIHFHALLDPAFGSSEEMYIILGHPIGAWLDGPAIKVECIGNYEGYEILHATLYLPTSFKRQYLQASYKYVKAFKGVNYEFISRPKIGTEHQGLLNRTLILRPDDWKGVHKHLQTENRRESQVDGERGRKCTS